MPLYEYQCQDCGEQKEKLQNMSDPPPKCCDVPMKKLISNTSFSLKGTGWASDGYGPSTRASKITKT